MKLPICPRHRGELGLRWKCNKKFCCYPPNWAPHKEHQRNGDRGPTRDQSRVLRVNTSILIPSGSRKYCTIHLSIWNMKLDTFHVLKGFREVWLVLFFTLFALFIPVFSFVTCKRCRTFLKDLKSSSSDVSSQVVENIQKECNAVTCSSNTSLEIVSNIQGQFCFQRKPWHYASHFYDIFLREKIDNSEIACTDYFAR